jgi:hypothetical protein
MKSEDNAIVNGISGIRTLCEGGLGEWGWEGTGLEGQLTLNLSCSRHLEESKEQLADDGGERQEVK